MERLTTAVVPPVGPLDAPIYFFGEAPGADEDRAGEPFVGDAGQLLNRAFNSVKIVRQDVLLWNIFSQRPPKNRINYFFQDNKNTVPTWEGEEHIEGLRKWLTERIRSRDEGNGGPNLLVSLGAVPTFILTGKKRITKWRGSVLPCTLVPGFKVYAMNHPSYVNRLINEPVERLMGERKTQQMNALPLFLIDLERVKEEAEFPELRYPERTFDWSQHFPKVEAALQGIKENAQILSVDIETLPSDQGPLVWMIGFSYRPDFSFTVPIIFRSKLCWTANEEAQIWRMISEIFLDPNIKKVFQGGSYDLSVLGRYYGLRVAKDSYEDTMLCHHASYPYLRKGLDTLCSIYTKEPYYKDEGKVHFGKRSTDESEIAYNGKDCCVTREIIPITWRNCRELGTEHGYKRTLSVFPSHLGMMLRGVKIDLKKKDQLGREFEEKAEVEQEKLNRLAGAEYTITKDKELKRLVYGYLGLDPIYHVKTGKETLDKNAIKRLKRKQKKGSEAWQILECITQFKKYQKLYSTYTSMAIDTDGRIRTTYGWVSTWRTNSSGSPFVYQKKKKAGGNLQNIPNPRTEEGRLVRSLFIPDEGKEMIASDLSQAEARHVAWEADDLVAIEAFNDPSTDIHWNRCREIFGIPSSVPYNKKAKFKDSFTGEDHTLGDLRYIAKRVVHAGNYGMGPYMLQSILIQDGFHLDFRTCKNLMLSFKNNNPMTVEWQRRIREKIRATRMLSTPLGRVRKFLGRVNDNLFRSAYAFSPQSTVGELLQLAIQDIWSRLPYVEILLNVHDEVVAQIDQRDRTRAISDIRSCMERPYEINGRPILIPCDFKVGPSWGELVEI